MLFLNPLGPPVSFLALKGLMFQSKFLGTIAVFSHREEGSMDCKPSGALFHPIDYVTLVK